MKGHKLDPSHQYLPNVEGTNCIFCSWHFILRNKNGMLSCPLVCRDTPAWKSLTGASTRQENLAEPHRNLGMAIPTKANQNLSNYARKFMQQGSLMVMSSYLNICLMQVNPYTASDFFNAVQDYFSWVLNLVLGEVHVAVHWEKVFQSTVSTHGCNLAFCV